MASEYAEALRTAELESLRRHLPGPCRLLELGAGNGVQARQLTTWGYEVTAIDVPTTAWDGERVFDVVEYDGVHIPCDAASIDVVFSSNVLEHVKDLPAVLGETRRVLRRGGMALHVLPSPAWRAWNIAGRYPYVAQLATGTATTLTAAASPQVLLGRMRSTPLLRAAARALWPGPHGEYPSALSELYYFSRRRWRSVFESHGFRVEAAEASGLFYTGWGLMHRHLSVAQREQLAPVLGSACNVFVCRVADDPGSTAVR